MDAIKKKCIYRVWIACVLTLVNNKVKEWNFKEGPRYQNLELFKIKALSMCAVSTNFTLMKVDPIISLIVWLKGVDELYIKLHCSHFFSNEREAHPIYELLPFTVKMQITRRINQATKQAQKEWTIYFGLAVSTNERENYFTPP